ncbi:MAG: hypothetical protein ACO260_05610, partial [Hylemonella sp.]
ADIDAGTGDSVSQSRKPFGVGFSLLDLDHALMYPMGNKLVKLGLKPRAGFEAPTPPKTGGQKTKRVS